jgi:hypothetical protein
MKPVKQNVKEMSIPGDPTIAVPTVKYVGNFQSSGQPFATRKSFFGR